MILEREGKGLFGAEEEIRFLCKILRFAYDPELDERLRARIERMDGGEAGRVVRAFSVYFQLVNVAERYHRVRRRRQYEAEENNEPQRASLRSTLGRLARDGAGAQDLERILEGMDISLVLTAHPTEAQRRTIRRRHGAIACILDDLDSGRFTARERKGTRERLAEEITLLWQTDELRAERPEVEGEIQRTLLFLKASLIPATLKVYRERPRRRARPLLRRRTPEAGPRPGVRILGRRVPGREPVRPPQDDLDGPRAAARARPGAPPGDGALLRPPLDPVRPARRGLGGAGGVAEKRREDLPRGVGVHEGGRERALPPQDALRSRAPQEGAGVAGRFGPEGLPRSAELSETSR